jgi:hypothetical protein
MHQRTHTSEPPHGEPEIRAKYKSMQMVGNSNSIKNNNTMQFQIVHYKTRTPTQIWAFSCLLIALNQFWGKTEDASQWR